MPQRAHSAAYAPGLIAVTYDRAAYQRSTSAFMRTEQSVGGTATQTFDFKYINKVTRILSVSPSQVQKAMATLRVQSGVLSVSQTGQRRYAMTVNDPYATGSYPWPNDPYFNGFTNPVPVNSATPSATYHVSQYDELDVVPGQWDMHAIKMEYVWGYSNASMNTANSAVLANFGSRSAKIAIIDTGEDTLHPELAANVGSPGYQRCFITNTSNVQSTSDFSTDPDGHGTNVSGIAAGVTNNSLGFGSAAGNTAQIYAYRVFPTPDDNCANPTSTDPACGSDTRDIAKAIDDAVTQNVQVISMSVGGGGCTNGLDSDVTEGNAVANAIAAHIVVVAASGNESASTVDAPGCDTDVIAVGASALSDGLGNGSGHSGGTITSPVEYVASYSNVGSPASNPRSATAWGIVAPGGDPSSDTDADDLHWIENIWTSAPYQSSPSDQTFTGTCTNDYPNSTQTNTPDCRTLIAGTSQATPHVAGVAALICAIAPGQCTPTNMKSLLCMTADDIGDSHEGCGRLNAYRAVATALGDPVPVP
jgi:subtilisin family serine protease